MTDCLPRARESSQPWLCNEPLLIQSHAYFDPVKKAKVKAVDKVRNKDLVLPLGIGWYLWDSSGKPRTCWLAVPMKRQAAEVVVISPLELCSMWSLRVTKDLMKVQQRRQGECHILYCEVMKRANTKRLRVPTQIGWDRQIPCATGQNRSI